MPPRSLNMELSIVTSIRDRAAASVRTPHAAILAPLEQNGPLQLSVLAAMLGMQVGALRPAIHDLHSSGLLFKRGSLVARANYYVRLSDGFHVASISCAGTPSAGLQARRLGPDAA